MRFSGDVVVRRLHALTAKGYEPELGIDGCQFVHMRHLGNGPELMLWGDGQLLNASPTAIRNEADRIIIGLEDEEGMRRFLSTVPKPTLIKRVLSTSIHDAVLNVTAWVVVIIVSFIFWVSIGKASQLHSRLDHFRAREIYLRALGPPRNDDLGAENDSAFASGSWASGLLALPLTIEVAHNRWTCE